MLKDQRQQGSTSYIFSILRQFRPILLNNHNQVGYVHSASKQSQAQSNFSLCVRPAGKRRFSNRYITWAGFVCPHSIIRCCVLSYCVINVFNSNYHFLWPFNLDNQVKTCCKSCTELISKRLWGMFPLKRSWNKNDSGCACEQVGKLRLRLCEHRYIRIITEPAVKRLAVKQGATVLL